MALYRTVGLLLGLCGTGLCGAAADLPDGRTMVSMLAPVWDPNGVVASVVDVQGPTTTFLVMCYYYPSCPEPATVIQAPDTFTMQKTYYTATHNSDQRLVAKDAVYDVDCKITSPKVTCTVSVDEYIGGSRSATAGTLSETNVDDLYYPVLVDAGAEKLRSAHATTTTDTTSQLITTATATQHFLPPVKTESSTKDDIQSAGGDEVDPTSSEDDPTLNEGDDGITHVVSTTDSAAGAAYTARHNPARNMVLPGLFAIFGGAALM